MNRIALTASRRPLLILCIIGLVVCGVTVLAVFGYGRSQLEARQAATPQAGFDCSAWHLTWKVQPEAGTMTDITALEDTRSVVAHRLDELEFFFYEFVLGESNFFNPTPAPNGTPVIGVELLFVAETDTFARLDAYREILDMPGAVAIVDPLERDPALGAIIRIEGGSTPGATATPVENGAAHPVIFDGDDIYFAYPELDASTNRHTVTIQFVEEAIPTMEAYLGDRPSRSLTVVLDHEVIAIPNIDPASLKTGSITIAAGDEDQANSWSIVLRSGKHDTLLVPVGREPVYHYLCG